MSDVRDYTYEILKLIQKETENFSWKDLDMDREDYIDTMKDIKDDRLVEGIAFSPNEGQPRIVFTNGLSLTRSGLEFIRLKEEGKI